MVDVNSSSTIVYGVLLCFTLCICAVVLYLRWQHLKNLSKNYVLAKLKLRKLPADSPTRKRIEAAQALWLKGWKAIKTKDPHECLSYFARAVEIDELGCGWRQQFEKRMEQIGDFFTLPPKDDRDKYQSMLAEAALLVLLHTVVSQQGAQIKDLEEDFEVVKTRLDVCVALQSSNPMTYKLRADFLQRFGHLANRVQLISDFKEAIRLAEDDDSGKSLNCEGVDPKQQRRYVLAYCYHQLGSLQHRNKELEAAADSYAKAVQYADPHFVNLADSHFALCILTLMRARSVKAEQKPGILLQATKHYKAALVAEKEMLKYLPCVNTETSRPLAKELLKRFAKTKSA